MLDRRTACFFLILAPACGARTESLYVGTADAGSPVRGANSAIPRGSDAGAVVDPPSDPDIQIDPVPVPTFSCPPFVDHGPIPTSACVGDVIACEVSGVCSVSAFSETMHKWLAPCAVSCAELDVGIHQGCATAVVGQASSVYGPAAPDPMGCLRAAILGSRWSCAAKDAWYPVNIGGCITR
jgi:hypothetical protein